MSAAFHTDRALLSGGRILGWGDMPMATIAASDESVLTAPAPADRAAPAAQRIEALDFVRGVALCGILLMNITGFGLPDAYTNPTNSGGATGADLWAWIITQMGFEGTQRALFSMLFGASVILLTSRLEASGRTDAADIYFRRNLWLIALRLRERLRLPLVRRHPLRLRRHRLVHLRLPQHGGEMAAGDRRGGAAAERGVERL